jgi:hypothetical protein
MNDHRDAYTLRANTCPNCGGELANVDGLRDGRGNQIYTCRNCFCVTTISDPAPSTIRNLQTYKRER